MNAAQWYVQDRLHRLAGDARAAATRARHARTLRELKDCSHVHADPVVASLRHMVPELKALKRTCLERAQELVDKDLDRLQKLKASDEAAFSKEASLVLHREWALLRGEWADVYVRAERSLAQLRR